MMNAIGQTEINGMIIADDRYDDDRRDKYSRNNRVYSPRSDQRPVTDTTMINGKMMIIIDIMIEGMKIKDLKEQLISVDEIIPYSSLVQTVRNGLHDS